MAKLIKKAKTTQLSVMQAREQRKWFGVDATGKTLGRLSTLIATLLRGKHRVNYTPHIDCGDGVVVLNVEKIQVTGAKAAQKKYYRHSGYPGGLKETSYQTMLKTKPAEILRHAVRGMMPKGVLGRNQLKRLRLFVGSEHNMQASQPIFLELSR